MKMAGSYAQLKRDNKEQGDPNPDLSEQPAKPAAAQADGPAKVPSLMRFSPLLAASSRERQVDPWGGQSSSTADHMHESVSAQIAAMKSLQKSSNEPFAAAMARPNANLVPVVIGGKRTGEFFLEPHDPAEPMFGVTAVFGQGSYSEVSGATERAEPFENVARGPQAERLAAAASRPDWLVEHGYGYVASRFVVRKIKLLPPASEPYSQSLNRHGGQGVTYVSPINAVVAEAQALELGGSLFAPLAYYTTPDHWDHEHAVPRALFTILPMASGDLLQFRPGREAPRMRLLNWVLQAAVSLSGQVAKLHEGGMLHNDIKPENVLCDPSFPDLFHLADYGLATDMPQGPVLGGWPSTPFYAAPEIFQKNKMRAIGPAVDAWALGLTLFDLATDFQRFESSDTDALADLSQTHHEISDAVPTEVLFDLWSKPVQQGVMPEWSPLAPNLFADPWETQPVGSHSSEGRQASASSSASSKSAERGPLIALRPSLSGSDLWQLEQSPAPARISPFLLPGTNPSRVLSARDPFASVASGFTSSSSASSSSSSASSSSREPSAAGSGLALRRFNRPVAPPPPPSNKIAAGLKFLSRELPQAAAMIVPLLSNRETANDPGFMAEYHHMVKVSLADLFPSAGEQATSFLDAQVRRDMHADLFDGKMGLAGQSFHERLAKLDEIPLA